MRHFSINLVPEIEVGANNFEFFITPLSKNFDYLSDPSEI